MHRKEIESEFPCVEPTRNALRERRAEQTVVKLIELGHWIGWLTFAGGCLVITSYAFELQLIRRPISEGAATHPLVGALFIICGLAIVAMRAMRTPLPAVMVVLGAGLVGVVRLADVILGIVTVFGNGCARGQQHGTQHRSHVRANCGIISSAASPVSES